MDRDTASSIFGQHWIHMHEEDSARGAVYRPELGDVPLSRRPRERLQLMEDGSALLLVPGPDDRLQEQPATWDQQAGQIVIRTGTRGPAPGRLLRVTEQTADRLVIRQDRAAT
jgi:hypothetical protein